MKTLHTLQKSFLVILLVLISAVGASAQDGLANPHFDEFYTVKDQPTSTHDNSSVSMNPLETVQVFWEQNQELSELRAAVLSLVNFDHHQDKYGDVNEPYNRLKQFGTWINDRHDNTCYNTRAKVLIRDSSEQVTFTRTGCTVATGKWADPYGGRDYTQASDIQIDHFVPLKNAYISGAYKWTQQKRCLYANFLGNPFHLLAVYGKENTSKGDRTPEGYMPSDSSYQCQYLAQWLKVKLIWDLGLTPPEKDKVLELIQNNHCSASDLTYSIQDLNKQRQFMADNMDLCQ